MTVWARKCAVAWRSWECPRRATPGAAAWWESPLPAEGSSDAGTEEMKSFILATIYRVTKHTGDTDLDPEPSLRPGTLKSPVKLY